MDDEQRKSVLGEALMDELRAIREQLDDLPAIKRDVAVLREDVDAIKIDVSAIKAAIRDVSETLRRHDEDIALLKRRVA